MWSTSRASDTHMVSGVHHIALLTTQVEALAQFYEDVLGLLRERAHHFEDGSLRSVWLWAGQTRIMVERTQELGPGQNTGWQVVAFAIEENQREAARDRLARAGYPVTHETDHTLYSNDPDGNRIALSHYQ